jgi:hypothetical protein
MCVLASMRWLAVFAFAAMFVIVGDAQSEPNCTCRYKGQSYALDTCVCLSTAEGPRMACCGLVLNNTSWNFTKKHCPVVENTPPRAKQSYAAWHQKGLEPPKGVIR